MADDVCLLAPVGRFPGVALAAVETATPAEVETAAGLVAAVVVVVVFTAAVVVVVVVMAMADDKEEA